MDQQTQNNIGRPLTIDNIPTLHTNIIHYSMTNIIWHHCPFIIHLPTSPARNMKDLHSAALNWKWNDQRRMEEQNKDQVQFPHFYRRNSVLCLSSHWCNIIVYLSLCFAQLCSINSTLRRFDTMLRSINFWFPFSKGHPVTFNAT